LKKKRSARGKAFRFFTASKRARDIRKKKRIHGAGAGVKHRSQTENGCGFGRRQAVAKETKLNNTV